MDSDFDYAAARNALQQKKSKREALNTQQWKQANREADAIIKMLIEKYNPKRIYQWGSLLNRKTFSEMSDIDIAVEGVETPETFFAMFGDADNMATRSLDLVEIEKIEPVHAESIRQKGKLRYERRQ